MRIGVWNTAFLGDTILTLPLLQSIKKAFPEAVLDFWVRSQYLSLYQEQSGYTTYGYSKKENGLFRGLYLLGKNIQEKKYDIWINPHLSYRSSYIAWASKAKQCLTYNKPYINTFFSSHSIVRDSKKHEVYRLLSLAKTVGCAQEYTLPCYSLSSKVEKEVSLYWEENIGENCPSIALAIGALWKTKRWCPEYFSKIVKKGIKAGYAIVFVGGGAVEREILATILNDAGVEVSHPLIHNLLDAPLEYTAGILNKVTVCCGNDTGLMHLAWIQNIPTILLYGPTAESQGFSPLSEGSYSLSANEECSPCGKHGSTKCPKEHFNCMKNLLPITVWNAVVSVIEQKNKNSLKILK